MDKLEINGETWGRVLMGKQGSTPMYRKEIDGKMTPVRKHDVPQDVIEAFEGFGIEEVGEPTFEEMKEVADIIGDENIGGESVSLKNTPEEIVKNEFGFSGKEPVIDWKKEYENAVANSVDNLTLKDLAELMYTKYGVFTCYLQREPEETDVHPITGGLMTNFLRGQARQQYLSAVANRTNFDPDVMKSILKSRDNARFDFTAHREAHRDRFVKPDIEKPTPDNPYADKSLTMAEWKKMRESEEPLMTSEHGRRGDGTDEDELYAEPPINGRTIIRPYATNPIAERRLAEKRAKRGQGF